MNRLFLAPTSLPDAPALELLDAAAAAGFDGVGLRVLWPPSRAAGNAPLAGDPALISDIKSRMADLNIAMLDLYSFYLTPNVDLDMFAAAMEAGARLGAKYAVVVGHDPDPVRATETFQQICDLASQFGLVAVLEFAPHRQPSTLGQALTLLDECARDNIALLPDPAHLLASGGTLADLSAVEPGRLPYTQFCDIAFEVSATGDGGKAPRTIRRIPPGTGILPLARWLSALPIDIPVSIECFPPAGPTSHAAWARTLADHSRRELEACRIRPAGTALSD